MHVLDASRVVDVVSSLLSDTAAAALRAGEPRAAGSSCASSTARGASARCCRTQAALDNRLQDRLGR